MVTFDPLYGGFFKKRVFRYIGDIFGTGTPPFWGNVNQKIDDILSCFLKEETVDAVDYSIGKAARDMQIGIENGGPGTCRGEDFLELKGAIRGEWGLLLDVGHANIHINTGMVEAKTMEDYIQNLPVPVIDVHISDNDGAHDQHLPPGSGKIDFFSLISALKRQDYPGSFVFEIAGNSLAAIEKNLPISRKMLKIFLNEVSPS